MMKERLHEIIFEADTKKGKLFDSVESIDKKIGHILYILMDIYFVIYYWIFIKL